MARHPGGPDGYFLHCVDPGGDTGMSLLHVQPEELRLVEYATIPWQPRNGHSPIATLTAWRQAYRGPHVLLYEDFHLRNTEEAASTDTTPLLVIGAIEQMMLDQGNPYEEVFTQEPVEAKHMATDEKLELLGLHLGHQRPQRHVRDANRHAVAHLAKRGYLPVCRIAFPRRSVRSPQGSPGPRGSSGSRRSGGSIPAR
jgi:hypothetical protein